MYPWILKAHMLFAFLSITGFVLRGLVMFVRPAWLQIRWVRTLPHINDTLLLSAGVWLAWTMGFFRYGLPDWLIAKLTALLAYIVLGAIALRRGRTRRTRLIAWVAALCTFAYIVAVAGTRMVNPLPLFF